MNWFRGRTTLLLTNCRFIFIKNKFSEKLIMANFGGFWTKIFGQLLVKMTNFVGPKNGSAPIYLV